MSFVDQVLLTQRFHHYYSVKRKKYTKNYIKVSRYWLNGEVLKHFCNESSNDYSWSLLLYLVRLRNIKIIMFWWYKKSQLTQVSPPLLPWLLFKPPLSSFAPTLGNFGISKLFNEGYGGNTGATTSSGRLTCGAANDWINRNKEHFNE